MAISQYVLFTVLAEDLPADTFRQQLKAARARHAALAITGAMLFDGEALLCLLEGEAVALTQARLALVQGLPAGAWKVLHDGGDASERLFKDWRVGYTEPELLKSVREQLDPTGADPAQAQTDESGGPEARGLATFVRLFNASDPQ